MRIWLEQQQRTGSGFGLGPKVLDVSSDDGADGGSGTGSGSGCAIDGGTRCSQMTETRRGDTAVEKKVTKNNDSSLAAARETKKKRYEPPLEQ